MAQCQSDGLFLPSFLSRRGTISSLMVIGTAWNRPCTCYVCICPDTASGSEPCNFTILLYRPRVSRVGAQWPTKFAFRSSPISSRASDKPTEPTAAHKNKSEGSLAVCCSMLRANVPSRCSPFAAGSGFDLVYSDAIVSREFDIQYLFWLARLRCTLRRNALRCAPEARRTTRSRAFNRIHWW